MHWPTKYLKISFLGQKLWPPAIKRFIFETPFEGPLLPCETDQVPYLCHFSSDQDEIWYKSRATQVVSTHQISSWSDEKWQRYGTCSVSQGRRGPSNWVSKMNLLKAGGHSFWPRKLIFGYVVAQYIYPKSYYYLLLIKSSVWPRQGPKDNQSVPKYRVRLYCLNHNCCTCSYIYIPLPLYFIRINKKELYFFLHKRNEYMTRKWVTSSGELLFLWCTLFRFRSV